MASKINNSTVNTPAGMGAGGIGHAKSAKKAEGAAPADAARDGQGAGAVAGDWNVSVSPKAREMAEARAKALEIARNTPDIREDRVADIKARIASGTYNVDAGDIADGMLREAVRDKLSTQES